MSEQFNLFGKGKTQVLNKNSNKKPEFNLFASNNGNGSINSKISLNNNIIKNQIIDVNQKEENKGNNINNNINKKNLNPKTFMKKPIDFLKASINFNLLGDDNTFNEINENGNNKNEINIDNINNKKGLDNFKNNNIIIIKKNNKNNSNKIQVKNNYNNNLNDLNDKRNNNNNKNENYNKDNNNDNNQNNNNNINMKDKKFKIKEKNNLYKSMIIFDEYKKEEEEKMKIKKENEISFKKKKENEKNKAEIIDKLKCYICYDKIKNPRMCKYCHRPACESCLKNWLDEKHQCAFCREKINYNETIEVPIINDIAEFFIKNINEKPKINNDKKNNENKNIFESKIDNNYTQIISAKLNLEENICQKHKKKYEYFCCQCNEKCCDKCLIFLNESSKKHQNHLIVPLDQMEKKDSKFNQVMIELEKLNQSNSDLDNLIKFCELKIRELEIEKNNFIDGIDIIKDKMNNQFKDISFNRKIVLDNIKSQNEEFTNSIETTPMALKNIITLNDHGQGKQIYNHLANLNKFALEEDLINLPKQKFFIETFISNPIEITISEEGNIELNNNEQIYNLIPNYDMKLTFENNAYNTSIKIKLNKKIDNNDIIMCFAIFRNKKYGCEFIKMKRQIIDQKEIQLYTIIGTNVLFSFKDENNKISFKLYFTVYKS